MEIRRKHGPLTYARRILAAVVKHPANEGHVIRAVTRACVWQVYKRTVGRPVTTTIGPRNAKLRLHADSSSCGNVAYFTWRFDYWESEFLVRYLRPGDNVVDMGANIGFFTVLAASLVEPHGQVVAIEPFPGNAERIKQAVALNGFQGVRVEQCAVGDKSGTVEFIADMDVSNRIASSADVAHARRIQVAVKRPDDLLPTGQRWAFWKVDVEGAETDGLRGATNILDSNPPDVIQVELIEHLLRAQGSSVEELVELVGRLDYSAFVYSPADKALKPVELERVNGNVLLIRNAALSSVAARLTDGHAVARD